MQPFPHRSELQFLAGRTLESISLGYGLILFDFGQVSINVEDSLEHVDTTGAVRRQNFREASLSPIFLHHLVQQKVYTVETEPFCLSLVFDRGDIVRIFSDTGPYECGQIWDENGHWIIF